MTRNLALGTNDKTNRSCLAGRYSSQFIDRDFDKNHFTLHHPTHLSD